MLRQLYAGDPGNIIEYALQENLKEYGWSIEPPKNYKQVYKQQELFSR